MFDAAYARTHFPALATPWAFFDHAGGCPPARGVIDRVKAYMERTQVQLGATHALSQAAAEAVEAGRRAAERLVGAQPGEVVLGPSTTALAGRLAEALGETFAPGDEVVVTNLDHEANIGAWRRLAARGVVVREWAFRPGTMRLELADLEPLLNRRTRLVAFTHVSNIVGTVHDVPAITARIRAAGALSCVDGVAFAPHRPVDVHRLGADFYLVSLYKVFGPHVGLLWGRREALQRGRNQNHFFVGEDAVPYKYEPGGVCHELVAGLPGIVEYLDDLAAHHGDPLQSGAAGAPRWEATFARIADHEEALVAPLLGRLAERPRVRVLGEAAADQRRRVATVAFTVEGTDSSALPAALDPHELAIRFGHFYAHRAVSALGAHAQQGVVRISMLHTNTAEEVQRLLAVLADTLPR